MFIVLEMNTFDVGTNTFCTSDKLFSAGDEPIENAHSNFSHTHTASYQRFSNRTYLDKVAIHKYSPLKTGGSFHALILTSEYATPTTYIWNSVFCWTNRPLSTHVD